MRRTLPPVRASARAGAFTLVELLVVIGIIALLISILLPALNRARASANQTKCAANLRTIGQAIQLYAVANKGSLPIGFSSRYGPNGAAGSGYTNWGMLLLNAMDPKVAMTSNEGYGDGAISANTAKSRAALFCPDVPGQSMAASAIEITHYMANPRLIPNTDQAEPAASPIGAKPSRPGYKLAKVKRSAEVCAIFDGSLISPYTAYNSSPDPDLWGPGENSPVANYLDTGAMGYGAYFIFDANYTNPNAGYATSGIPINLQPANGTVADFNKDTSGNRNNIRFRHMKDTKANALCLDGHVMTFTLKTNPTAGGSVAYNASDAKRENFYVNRP